MCAACQLLESAKVFRDSSPYNTREEMEKEVKTKYGKWGAKSSLMRNVIQINQHFSWPRLWGINCHNFGRHVPRLVVDYSFVLRGNLGVVRCHCESCRIRSLVAVLGCHCARSSSIIETGIRFAPSVGTAPVKALKEIRIGERVVGGS